MVLVQQTPQSTPTLPPSTQQGTTHAHSEITLCENIFTKHSEEKKSEKPSDAHGSDIGVEVSVLPLPGVVAAAVWLDEKGSIGFIKLASLPFQSLRLLLVLLILNICWGLIYSHWVEKMFQVSCRRKLTH